VGGLVYASSGPAEVVEVVCLDCDVLEPPEEHTPPPAPVKEQPAPPAPAYEPAGAAAPATALEVPEVTPTEGIRPEAPGVEPIDLAKYQGNGPRGPAIVPPTAQPAGPVTGGGGKSNGPYPLELVEERPMLDRTGLNRALERNYPSLLRDSRVSGRVLIELVVDENGHPIPGSARVVEASHPAFAEATLRMAERFRFRPARINGTPVPVVVVIPIVWTVP
jgi:TonB family protein